MNRRSFLASSAVVGSALLAPNISIAAMHRLEQKIKIGLIADLHQDVMHDGTKRMQAFVEHMRKESPDAIMQLGDFAYPNEKNQEVIKLFNGAHKNSLHVIGNHDTDEGHSKQQIVDNWGMDGRYYAKNINGLWFVVLDGNDPDSPTHQGGYARYIGPEQQKWLKEQLQKLDGPIIVVSHQPIGGVWGVDNAKQLQTMLGEASDKVILAINGHSHIDMVLRIKSIPYLHINSASYQWVGGNHIHQSYDEKIHAQYPDIQYTCPYKESLFATLELDPETNSIIITGRESSWVGPSPEQLGKDMDATLTPGEEVAPRIRNRTIMRVKKS